MLGGFRERELVGQLVGHGVEFVSASAGSGGSVPAAPSTEGDIDCDKVNGPTPTPPGDPDGLDGDGDGLACE